MVFEYKTDRQTTDSRLDSSLYRTRSPLAPNFHQTILVLCKPRSSATAEAKVTEDKGEMMMKRPFPGIHVPLRDRLANTAADTEIIVVVRVSSVISLSTLSCFALFKGLTRTLFSPAGSNRISLLNARDLKHDIRFRGRVFGCQWYHTVCLFMALYMETIITLINHDGLREQPGASETEMKYS